MSNIELILLIFLISFIVLVVLLAIMFCVSITAFRALRSDLKELDIEVKSLVHNMNTLTVDVHRKMQFFDPLFGAIANLGKGLDIKAAQYRDRQYSCTQKAVPKDDSDTVADFVRLALIGVNLWLSMKDRRSSNE